MHTDDMFTMIYRSVPGIIDHDNTSSPLLKISVIINKNTDYCYTIPKWFLPTWISEFLTQVLLKSSTSCIFRQKSEDVVNMQSEIDLTDLHAVIIPVRAVIVCVAYSG